MSIIKSMLYSGVICSGAILAAIGFKLASYLAVIYPFVGPCLAGIGIWLLVAVTCWIVTNVFYTQEPSEAFKHSQGG